jgi:hypothetical protein
MERNKDTYYIGKQYSSKPFHLYRCIWNSYYETIQLQNYAKKNLGATQTDTEIKDERGWERFVSVFVCVAPKNVCCNFAIVLFNS